MEILWAIRELPPKLTKGRFKPFVGIKARFDRICK